MFKFGLKLWSSNRNYVEEAAALYKKGVYQYIELFVLPDIDETQVSLWECMDIPYVIHAPHFRTGFNLADKKLKDNNFTLFRKTAGIADRLNANKIIVHPGVAGDTAETVRQLKEINDERILIENKPYHALDKGLICNGATVPEIKFILNNTDVQFCLDIGHAIYAANAVKIEPLVYLKEFITLNPEMFHLSDGDYGGVYDRHDHFGRGNFDIESILRMLPDKVPVTIETAKDFQDSLSDFEIDIQFLKELWNTR